MPENHWEKSQKTCIEYAEKLDLFGLFCYNINMKKAVGINEVSKEELYNLYLKLLKKNEKLEAKFLAMQMELGEKSRKLEEYNFQLAKRNRIIFGKRRGVNELSQNKFNEAECNQSKNHTRGAIQKIP